MGEYWTKVWNRAVAVTATIGIVHLLDYLDWFPIESSTLAIAAVALWSWMHD